MEDDLVPELVQEGENLINDLIKQGYGDIMDYFSHTAMDFLENLTTLQEPIQKALPQILANDIPILKFHHDAKTGNLIAKCVYVSNDWKSLLYGLIQAAYHRFDKTKTVLKFVSCQEIEAGFVTEIEITAKQQSQVNDIHTSKMKEEEYEAITDNHQRISPASFCKVLPFHFMLDCNMTIVQIGHALARVMRNLRLNQDKFSERFDMLSPALPNDFETFKAWYEIPVIIRYIKHKPKLREPTNKGTLSRCYSTPTKGKHPSQTGDVTLKGQMSYIEDSNQLLFLGSPFVQSIDELSRQGLFLSDIPLHDGTRDLLLLNEQLQVCIFVFDIELFGIQSFLQMVLHTRLYYLYHNII